MSARGAARDPPRRRPGLGTNPTRASAAALGAAPPPATHALPSGFPKIRAGRGCFWGPRGLRRGRLRSPRTAPCPALSQACLGGLCHVGAEGDRWRPGKEPDRDGRPARTPSAPTGPSPPADSLPTPPRPTRRLRPLGRRRGGIQVREGGKEGSGSPKSAFHPGNSLEVPSRPPTLSPPPPGAASARGGGDPGLGDGGRRWNPCSLFGDLALSRALYLKLTPASTPRGPVGQMEWQGQAGPVGETRGHLSWVTRRLGF